MLVPWMVLAGFLVLGACGFFFMGWLARQAMRWVLAAAAWTQERR
jgi:HAMP domain-containing protein